MTHPQALIFDLGNVVFKISFDYALNYWAKATGAKFKQLKDNYTFDAYYDKFEKSQITPLEFKNHLEEKLKVQFGGDAFEKGWNAIYDEVFPEIPGLLATLKKSYRLVALTNTNEAHYPAWTAKYAKTLEIFERVFCSHLIQHRKPEPASYQVVLDYLQLPPARTWFFDDNPENVTAAKNMGINTVLVTSFEKMRADLEQQGILSA